MLQKIHSSTAVSHKIVSMNMMLSQTTQLAGILLLLKYLQADMHHLNSFASTLNYQYLHLVYNIAILLQGVFIYLFSVSLCYSVSIFILYFFVWFVKALAEVPVRLNNNSMDTSLLTFQLGTVIQKQA